MQGFAQPGLARDTVTSVPEPGSAQLLRGIAFGVIIQSAAVGAAVLSWTLLR